VVRHLIKLIGFQVDIKGGNNKSLVPCTIAMNFLYYGAINNITIRFDNKDFKIASTGTYTIYSI
jgi:hypothetical protein